MKKYRLPAALIVLLFCSLLSPMWAEEFVLPAHPADMLKCLPPADKDWRLTVSKGADVMQSRPMAKVTRVYNLVDNTLPGSQPATSSGTSNAAQSTAKATATLTLVDTAGNDSIPHFFSNPQNARGNVITVGAFPATRMALGPGETDHVEMLVLNRFVLTIVLTGSSPDKVEQWLKKLDLAGLQRLAESSERVSNKKDLLFNNERVDELNPGQNFKRPWSIAPEDPPPKPK